MDERQTINVVDAVRLALADGEFHTYTDLFGQVARATGSRPDWRDVAHAAHEVGTDAGYVIRP